METAFEHGIFHKGDTIEVMSSMESGSVDMILADLPYGTTQNAWDTIIPLDEMWREYNRLTRDNSAIILTAAQPFTSKLIMSNPSQFKYVWVWSKNKATGHLNAKKRPLAKHEDIVVFSNGSIPYYPQGLTEKNTPTINKGNRGTKEGGSSGTNYGTANKDAIQTHTNYPTSILEIPVDMSASVHPTQKPVELFEYLIRTYSKEGDHILDNTAGSGTTAIAAINTDRRWTCIEKDENYYEKAVSRIQNHTKPRVIEGLFD